VAAVVAVIGVLLVGALLLAFVGDRRRAARPIPPTMTMRERRRQLRAERRRWF
jgi:hypothetical protein